MAYYARYRGAGASLLGDNSGIHSKTEADRLIDRLLGRRPRTIASRPVEPINDRIACDQADSREGICNA